VEHKAKGGERKQQNTRENEMLPSSAMHGFYGPDTLKAMGAAFDTAVRSIPPHLQDYERARRRLALLIVRHMESGEPNANLGTLALLDFLRPLNRTSCDSRNRHPMPVEDASNTPPSRRKRLRAYPLCAQCRAPMTTDRCEPDFEKSISVVVTYRCAECGLLERAQILY
jgi:hypothetical protein